MNHTKVSITHEGGPDHGPISVTRTWTKNGTQPAGAVQHDVLRAPSHQATFELEDGVEIAIAAGDATAPSGQQGSQQ